LFLKVGFWPRQVGHQVGQTSRQVGQSRNRLMIVVVQYTLDMNINFNKLELLVISFLKKETTLLDKFHI
jgi:hypothetical protein